MASVPLVGTIVESSLLRKRRYSVAGSIGRGLVVPGGRDQGMRPVTSGSITATDTVSGRVALTGNCSRQSAKLYIRPFGPMYLICRLVSLLQASSATWPPKPCGRFGGVEHADSANSSSNALACSRRYVHQDQLLANAPPVPGCGMDCLNVCSIRNTPVHSYVYCNPESSKIFCFYHAGMLNLYRPSARLNIGLLSW